MLPKEFPRVLTAHNPDRRGIHLKDFPLVVQDYSLAGPFKKGSELFLRFPQRNLGTFSLRIVNDAGADQILALRRQAQQPDLGRNETAIWLPVNPFKNGITSRQGLIHYFASPF